MIKQDLKIRNLFNFIIYPYFFDASIRFWFDFQFLDTGIYFFGFNILSSIYFFFFFILNLIAVFMLIFNFLVRN